MVLTRIRSSTVTGCDVCADPNPVAAATATATMIPRIRGARASRSAAPVIDVLSSAGSLRARGLAQALLLELAIEVWNALLHPLRLCRALEEVVEELLHAHGEVL